MTFARSVFYLTDIRRKVDELAVRWKMKDPGRADETTEYSAVPLLDSNRDDADDEVRLGAV